MDENILKNYLQKLLQIQETKRNQPLNEKELKEVALEFGLSEDDLNVVEKTFQDHLALGKNFIDYRNYEEAVKELEQALVLKPLNEETLWQLAQAHQNLWKENKSKKYKEEALKYARLCLKANPKSKDAAKLISLLTNKIKIQESKETAKPAIKIGIFFKYGLLTIALATVLGGGILWSGGIDFRSFFNFSPSNKTLANTEKIQIINAHTQTVNIITSSPQSDYFASGSDDNTVKIWNMQSISAVQTLKGHTEAVLSLAFSPDGEKLVSGSKDKTIKLWNFKTGVNTQSFSGHTDFVNYVVFSPDGRLIASASADKQIKIWEVQTGKCLKTLSGHKDQVNIAVFSPDGLYILSGGNDKALKLWNVATGQLLKTFFEHSDAVTSLVFTRTFRGNGHYSGQGYYFISGSKDDQLIYWKTFEHVEKVQGANYAIYANYIIDAKPEKKVSLRGFNKYMTASADMEYLSLIGNDSIKILQSPTMTEVKRFPLKGAFSSCFTHKGDKLIFGGLDGKIYINDFETDKIIVTLKPDVDQYGNYDHQGLASVILSPDNQQVYVLGGEYSAINVFDFKTAKKIRKFKFPSNYHLIKMVMTTSGKFLYALNSTNIRSVIKIDAKSGQIIAEFGRDVHNTDLSTLVISSDDKYLATGDRKGKLVVWDLEKEDVLQILKPSSQYSIDKFTFSPNVQYLASWYERELQLWDFKNGKELMSWEAGQGGNIVFSPDNKKIFLSGWYANNMVFDMDSKKSQEIIKAKGGAIDGAGFSPDGKYLFLSNDEGISCYDAQTYEFIKNLYGHHGQVLFTKDGKNLLSFANYEVKIWQLKK